MLVLTLVTISLGCVSAVDIDDNMTAETISDNSQIEEINEINNLDLKENSEDTLSASDDDVVSAITPDVKITDNAHTDEINNITKGTTVTINVQSTANYNYHYDSKVATLYVNGNGVKSTNLLPYNYNDNDRRGSFDYTFTNDGTYEIKVMTEPYNGGGDYYLAGTSNIITYIVGTGGSSPNPETNGSGENPKPTTNVSATISIYDNSYPNNSSITHSGNYFADLYYRLSKTGSGFSDEVIDVYINGQKVGYVTPNSQNRLGNITISEDNEYDLYVVYRATVGDKEIEATSNVIKYITKNTSGDEPVINNTNTSEEDHSGVSIKIRDSNYVNQQVISLNSPYNAVIEYYVNKPSGSMLVDDIIIYCNGNAVETISSGVDKTYTKISAKIFLNETKRYIISAQYKYYVFMGDMGDVYSNSIVYKVVLTNGTTPVSNDTKPENNTGNNTNPTNDTNQTGDNTNQTGNNTNPENTTSKYNIIIQDALNPAKSIIEVTLNDTYFPNVQYKIDQINEYVIMPQIDVYVNGVHPAGAGIYNENEIVYDRFVNIGKCFNFTQSGTYKVKLVYKTQSLLGIEAIELTSNEITYKITIDNTTAPVENNTNQSGETNTTGGENQTGDNTNQTGNDTASENTTSKYNFSIQDALNPSKSVVEVTLNATYIPNVQYKIDQINEYVIMPQIDVYVNGVHPAGAGIYNENEIVYGRFVSLGNCFNFTQSGTYKVKLVYKTQSLLGIEAIELTSNEITYKITIDNTTAPVENNTNQSGQDQGENTTDKVQPTISTNAAVDGKNVRITVTLPSDATGSVVINVAGRNYPAVINNGVASLDLTNQAVGSQDYTVTYPGNNKYKTASVGGKFTIEDDANVSQGKVSPEMSSKIKMDGDKTLLEVNLPNDATGNVVISVDGKEFKSVSVENGVANVELDLNEGSHLIEANYLGNEKYNSANSSNKVIISGSNDNAKKDTVINVDSKFSRVANDFAAGERGAMFYATLTDLNGNPLANKTVQIAVNGPIYNVTTDKDGKAGLTVNLANANTYTYALSFKGDDEYKGSPLASSKLTVTKKSTSISASAKTFKASAKKTISVTLKTSKNPYNGKTYLSAGKKLTLKVNGKTYTAKTNAKGVAKFTIKLTKKGTYTAKISFTGDKTYNAANKSIKVTIK